MTSEPARVGRTALSSQERLLVGGSFLFLLLAVSGILVLVLTREFEASWWSRFFLLGVAFSLGTALFFTVCRWPETLLYLALGGVTLDQWESLARFGIPYLTISKVLVFLGLFIILLRSLLSGRNRPPLLFPTAALAHLPFSFMCLVSTLAFSYSYRSSIRWLIAPLFLPVMSIVLSQCLRTRREAIRLVKGFALLSFFPMLTAFIEIFSGVHLMGPAEIVHYGVSNIFRIAGNFENPNDFVVLMLFSLPVLLLWNFHTTSWRVRLALLFGTALQSFIFLKTYSRSGYVSMGFTFFSLVFLGRGKIRRTAVFCCVVGAVLLLALPDVRDRMLTLFGIRAGTVGVSQAFTSLNVRKILMVASWNEFLRHPILGIGFGNLGFHVKEYSTLAEGITAENTYLQILAEMGAAGLAAYFLFLGVAWKGLIQGLKACRTDPQVEPLYVGLAAGYCGFAFNSLLDTNLSDNLPWVLLPILIFLSPAGETAKWKKSD